MAASVAPHAAVAARVPGGPARPRAAAAPTPRGRTRPAAATAAPGARSPGRASGPPVARRTGRPSGRRPPARGWPARAAATAAGSSLVPVTAARRSARSRSVTRCTSSAPTASASWTAAAGDTAPARTGRPAAAPSMTSAARTCAGSRSAEGTQTSPSPSTPIRRSRAPSAATSAATAAAELSGPYRHECRGSLAHHLAEVDAGRLVRNRAASPELARAVVPRGDDPPHPPRRARWLRRRIGRARRAAGLGGAAGGNASDAAAQRRPCRQAGGRQGVSEAGVMPVVEHDDRLATADRCVHELEAGERHLPRVGPGHQNARGRPPARSAR